MAREFGPVNVEIWSDPEWRRLPPAAQHLYLTLWTSPGLSYCGVHDWRPKRLAKLSSGFTGEQVERIGDCLQSRHFLVIDEETDEVLVRSWARFDGLVKKPRMAVSYAAAYAAVASADLRAVLVHETKKMRELWPDLACWRDSRVLAILDHPAESAKDLPTPSDPFADGLTDAVALGLPPACDPFATDLPSVCGKPESSLPPVCDPPTPAPAPAPTPTPGTSAASADAEREFDEFWSAYPKKRDKGHAVRAYRAARKKADAEAILGGLRRQLPLLEQAEEKFRPYAATWLNGERWADELPATPGPTPDGGWVDTDGIRYNPDGSIDESSLPPVAADNGMRMRPGR